MDHFVFLSHASKDKPLLGELVEALIDAGIKIWIDVPTELGYSARDIEVHFYRLRAGGRWEDEIDDAKRKAACILVCWSGTRRDRKPHAAPGLVRGSLLRPRRA